MDKTSISIISGFLGAGKTTLIKDLLKRKAFGSDPVLVENDYGSLSIDSLLMQETGIVVKEVDSGCICCTLIGRFRTGIEQILEEYRPEHLIIEPSGVGKLSNILRELKEVYTPDNLEIEQVVCITVVNASLFDHNDRYVHEYFWDQVKYSNVALINRAENMEESEICRMLESFHSKAPSVHTLIGTSEKNLERLERYIKGDDGSAEVDDDLSSASNSLGSESQLKLQQQSHEESHAHDEHAHDDHAHDDHSHSHSHKHVRDFQTWSSPVEGYFSYDDFERFSKVLQSEEDLGHILRVKGLFPGKHKQNYLFDYVPGQGKVQEVDIQESAWVMVIGKSLNEKSLELIFSAAETKA